MIRFIDGFDHYATADITKKWNVAPTATINAGGGRFGGNALRVNDVATGYIRKTLDAQPTWIVGFGIIPTAFTYPNTPVLQLLDQGANQVELRVYSDGTLALTRNGASLAGGLSTFSLKIGAWYFIEVKVTIAPAIAGGQAQVHVNGQLVIDVTAGQQTQNTANATANSIQIAGVVPNTSFDDVYICDGTGLINNNFLGDCRVVQVLPNGAGDQTMFGVVGAVNNWAAVDEIPPDNDATYVFSQTPGQRDLYVLQAFPLLLATIKGIQTVLDCRDDDVGPRTVAASIKTGGTTYDGLAFAPGVTYQFATETREVNPFTAVAWTPADLVALQAGVKLVS